MNQHDPKCVILLIPEQFVPVTAVHLRMNGTSFYDLSLWAVINSHLLSSRFCILALRVNLCALKTWPNTDNWDFLHKCFLKKKRISPNKHWYVFLYLKYFKICLLLALNYMKLPSTRAVTTGARLRAVTRNESTPFALRLQERSRAWHTAICADHYTSLICMKQAMGFQANQWNCSWNKWYLQMSHQIHLAFVSFFFLSHSQALCRNQLLGWKKQPRALQTKLHD